MTLPRFATLIFAVVFTTLEAHSQFLLTRSSENPEQLFLYAKTCAEVKSTAQDLAAWTKSIHPEKPCPLSVMKTQLAANRQSCSLDITRCVPDHVAKYVDVSPDVAGPNCWNLALVMKGILPSLRFTSPEEMAFYMKPPLCRALGPDEKKQPGDVGAIRTQIQGKTTEVHGFIYVSDKIAYSKNGYVQEQPYRVQPLESVHRLYGVPRNPVTYHRCISLDEYFSSHPDLPEDLVKVFAEINELEDCVENRLFQKSPLTTTARQNLSDTASALSAYYQQEMKSPTPAQRNDEKRKFLLNALRLRLYALSEQMARVDSPELANDSQYLADIIGFSLEEPAQ